VNIEQLVQRVEILHKHITDLSETAYVLTWIPSELRPQAFHQLYSAAKNIQVEAEEVYQQHEELIQTHNLLATERQYYQNLFELAPDAYLVTNPEGIIQSANTAAARLINVAEDYLRGKSIIDFVFPAESQQFTTELIQISHSQNVKEILLLLQQHYGKFIAVSITVTVIDYECGQPTKLLWLLRDTSGQRLESHPHQSQQELTDNRPIYKYDKGDNIPLNPLVILYVCRGLVKLSTFCETGEEILIGLVAEEMVFGSSMTSLPIYQATAQTDVELVSINVSEIAFFSTLSHALLPKIQQRLQQTESFLVISGRRRVQERLHHLLEFLKQQVGQRIPEGIRLSVRFTHEDIANTCCTTRVTITRLIGKLQEQGIIMFDDKKHMIFPDIS